MRRRGVGLLAVLTLVSLGAGPAGAKNYAVLISAGQTTSDGSVYNSEYWYDLVLTYRMLVDQGYDHDDIFVLYGDGQDFPSQRPCYQNPYPVDIVDLPNDGAHVEAVFDSLAGLVTDDDVLYVWWMGHGSREWWVGGFHLKLLIENTGETLWDVILASHIDQVEDYRLRVCSFMTCFSGGIIDDLEGAKSVVITSSTFEQPSASDLLCDTWHAELNYFEAGAFHGESPCGLCGPVDADGDGNGWISVGEAYEYADAGMVFSDPLVGDPGALGPTAHLAKVLLCCPDGSGNAVTIQQAIDVAGDGYTIELCRGTFSGPGNREIDFSGKAVTVRSEDRDPGTCTIDCGEAGRGFLFHTGEDSTSVLEGVRIANGLVEGDGGAILCLGSSPTLVRCALTGNQATGRGGGIHGNGSVGGEEIYVATASDSIRVACSAVDSGGVGGAGTVRWLGSNLFVDPGFCSPALPPSAPTLAGDYHLLESSPCADPPGCGLVGGLAVGCDPGTPVADRWTLAPRCLHLARAVPNPFGSATRIAYSVPPGEAPCPVHLAVYDVLGRRVRTLVDDVQPEGTHEVLWDGRDEEGRPVVHGVYFCCLRAKDLTETERILRLR